MKCIGNEESKWLCSNSVVKTDDFESLHNLKEQFQRARKIFFFLQRVLRHCDEKEDKKSFIPPFRGN